MRKIIALSTLLWVLCWANSTAQNKSLSSLGCDVYLDPSPLARSSGYGEEHIAPGLYSGLAQRYNNLSGTITKIKFRARTNPASAASNTAKVIIYNEQTGSGLPGVILGQSTVTIYSNTVAQEVVAVLGTPITLTSPNVIIISVEPFFSTDDFFLQHNQAGDISGTPAGDGQNLWLNLIKQGNVWFHNLANGDPTWNYDFLILPITTSVVTSAYTHSENILTTTFTNASVNAFSYYWTFGDGNTSIQTSPAHTYATGGTYSVKLKAFAADSSCYDSTSQFVTVSVTGVNEINAQKKEDLIISYSSPNNLLTLESSDDLEISICNILGVVMGKHTLARGGKKQINIEHFYQGLYFICPSKGSPHKFYKY